MRIPLLPTLALVGALAGSAPTAHAWGAAGHQIVATIAQIHLPPPVLRLVCDILQPTLDLSLPAPILSSLSSSSSSSSSSSFSSADPYPPCSLAPIAAWADQIRMKPAYRYTAPLHYVNALSDAPPSQCAFPGARGWAGRPAGNVLAALGNVTSVLREFVKGERDVEAAAEAVKFLVHWMGDVHQPLHLSGREKGGNGAKVAWNGRSTNLHSVWDGLLIAQSIRQTPRNYSWPLEGPEGAIVEPHLRGAIYDAYIRRIMHEGLAVGGRFDEESQSWLDCPKPDNANVRTNTGSNGEQELLSAARPGAESWWDDGVVCPYAWGKPIHELNCELPVWPRELDDFVDTEGEVDGEGRPALFELDTPEYAGKIAHEWVVERLLAMAGVRLAGVLTDVFAEAAGEAY